MNVKECNYYGFDHKAVAEKFEGDLTYVGDMCLNEGQTVAVYKAANPDRSKGHKEFMLLQYLRGSNRGVVAGRELEEIQKHSSHSAVLCTQCNTLLYSVHRHHFHSCGCPNETFVDGGKEYLRSGGVSRDFIQTGTYDVLTKTWTPG